MSGFLLQAIADQLMPRPPKRIGVAVSGGGDSVALLCLLAEFAQSQPMEIHAVSIDHGLREAAVEEVREVTNLCGRLGVPHHVEYWQSWSGDGNLMSQARTARYDLLTDWAFANGVNMVALGHTANDQAETLMMRLARGSGVDGLAAMSARRVHNGITWLRPLLRIHRRDLRYYLQDRNISWIEDPTNEDTDFERVRMRDALRLLEPLGFGTDTLVEVANHMSKAREALDWQTFLEAKEIVRVSHGAIVIELRRFRTLPEEIRRRMVVRALMWLSSGEYPPRRAAVLSALQAVNEGRKMTLEGCQIMRDDELIWISREYNAVRHTVSEVGDIWDNRWNVNGPEDDPVFEVRPLGEKGLKSAENWRSNGIPRSVLAVTPSVWEGDELIAAPMVFATDGWSAELEGGKDAFFAALLSH